jgi:peptide/nickel transport system substrate-binding protein
MTSSRTTAVFLAALGMAGLAAASPAQAQTLKIAVASEPTSADPYYHRTTQNESLSAHIFEQLIGRTADMKLVPGLATSWKNLDDTTWEFKLRDGVKFSNGQPFTSQDVLFSICRSLNNPTNVSRSYTDTTKRLVDVQTPDDHTVVVKTDGPIPLLPAEFAHTLPILWNGIVPHGKLAFAPKTGCGVTGPWPTAIDFNNGKDAIGTGPYLLKSYVPGNGIDLVRNENYWDASHKPHWKEVKFIPVPSAGPRLTGLLSGDFDMIENPAARDLQRIKNDPKFGFVATPSTRLIFFQPAIGRTSPLASAPDGKNPLADVRVRRAINMAIDRKTIVSRLMDGMATVAYQYMADGMFGALPKAPEIKYDPAQAKKLLAEAGYPNGFELTLSSTNDRYINDSQIVQAVAQYLSRIGIKTHVDAMAATLYFPKRAKLDFAFSIAGWPSDDGEASDLFHIWVTTYDLPNARGTSNYGRFSNADFDKAFLKGEATVDPAARQKLYEQATQIALDNVALIPLYFESSIWAFRKGITYEGRRDQYTLATSVKPTKM